MKSTLYLILLLNFNVLFSQNSHEQLNQFYANYSKHKVSNTDSALFYISRVFKIAKSINNNDWLSKSYYGLGYCYYLKREDSLSLVNMEKAVNYSIKSKNDDILSRAYNQIGLIYSWKNDYKRALKYYYNSLKISEENNALSDNTVSVLSNIADIHIWQKDSIQGMMYYYKAKGIGENYKSERLDNVYNNLGTIYMATKKDSALFYLKRLI